MTAPRWRGWPTFAALALVALGMLAAFWPGSPAPTAVLVVPSALALITAIYAWRVYPAHPLRRCWLLVAVGLSLTGLSVVVIVLDQLLGWSVFDLFAILNLIAYPFIMASQALRIRVVAGHGFSSAALLDALLVIVVASAFGFHSFLVVVPALSLPRVLGLTIPALMSLGLLLQALYLLYRAPHAYRASTRLLVIVNAFAAIANWLLTLTGLGAGPDKSLLWAMLCLTGTLLFQTVIPLLDIESVAREQNLAIERSHPMLLQAAPYLLLTILAIFVSSLSGSSTLHIALLRIMAVGILIVLARQWLSLRANSALVEALQQSHDALAKAHRRAEQEARTDTITSLPNQRMLREHLETILAAHRRDGAPLTLLFIDVDLFKEVNDRFGHAAGDAALAEIGYRLRQGLRDSDIIARYGGEEFVALLPATPEQEGMIVAKRLRLGLSGRPVSLPGGWEINVTISLGVAAIAPGRDTPDDLLRAADEALYVAKHAGRNRAVLADSPVSLTTESSERIAWSEAL